MKIKVAESNEEIMGCYEVLSQLRPHLSRGEFSKRILELAQNCGYKLAYLEDNGVQAVVGYRVSDWLHRGSYLEIEDLVTSESERSKGYGGKLFDWTINQAKDYGCNQVRLLSGVQRDRAHKFYLAKGMVWEAKYFSINV